MLDDLSERARDHFRTPRNAGALARPDAAATVQNEACGDVLRLSLALAGGRIREARFKTFGCAASIAAGSVLTELVQGLSLEQARALGSDDVLAALDGLPEHRRHAATLAVDCLRKALEAPS